MGRLVRCWVGGLGLCGLVVGCASFAEEPSVLTSEGDGAVGEASGSTSGALGDDAGTTGGSGGGASMTSPTSATSTAAPPGATMSTTGDPADDATGDNVDPTRADATGSDEETGLDPTDASDSGDPTSGGQDLDGCETTQLPEQIVECSQNSNDDADLTLSNNCATASVNVFWVTYNCNEMYLGTLAPGEDTPIQTYATHPFRVRNSATGALLRDIDPLTAGDHNIDVL